MQWIRQIGMFAINRPISSCLHATAFCEAHCYARKFYRRFEDTMSASDKRLTDEWASLNATDVAAFLNTRYTRPTHRLRLCARGEPFADVDDIAKIAALLHALPDTLIWAPTRAWRSTALYDKLIALRNAHSNLRLIASIDPTTTEPQYLRLKADARSTMYFGSPRHPFNFDAFRCPKTWKHINGHCAVCRSGCFSASPKDIHLKQH